MKNHVFILPCLLYRPVERRGEEPPLARYPESADRYLAPPPRYPESADHYQSPPPRYPESADRYQSFDNRPLAPERSALKKAEKKAAKLKAAAYAADLAYDGATRFEPRPQPLQQQQPLQLQQPLQQQSQPLPVEEVERYPTAPVYAPEPKKQKKVIERNAQASNDDISNCFLKYSFLIVLCNNTYSLPKR